MQRMPIHGYDLGVVSKVPLAASVTVARSNMAEVPVWAGLQKRNGVEDDAVPLQRP
jgi:hypothetical protein